MMSQYGQNMNEEEIFEELKTKLLEQTRLLSRFYEFCLAYQEFEFDEVGLNIDEADNEKRKALKIKDKLLAEINNKSDYNLEEESSDILKNKIVLITKLNTNESKKIVKFVLSVEKDSFTLELDN